jgi:ribonucleotide monophosphatase NagD (HAD superfamily)
MEENRSKTLFIDIDGTIFKHQKNATGACFYHLGAKDKLLPGVLDKFNEWHSKGHRLILTTGRPESMRQITEDQLRMAGLFWDMLLMGIGAGERILINDFKDYPKAIAINVPRDAGFEKINDLYHKAKVRAGASGEAYYEI